MGYRVASRGLRGFGSYSLKGMGQHFCPEAATDDRSVLVQTQEVPQSSPSIVGNYGDAPGWWCACPSSTPFVMRDQYYGRMCLKNCPGGYQPDSNNQCQAVAPSGTGSNAVAGPAPSVRAYGPPPVNPANAAPPAAQVTNAPPVSIPQNVQISSAVPPATQQQAPGISLPGLPSSIGGINLSSIPWWGWLAIVGVGGYAISKA